METKHSAYNLVVGDTIKLTDSDIIYRVEKITNFVVWLKNTNKNDPRIVRPISTTDYYRTEPIKRWQDKINEIGFEYMNLKENVKQ